MNERDGAMRSLARHSLVCTRVSVMARLDVQARQCFLHRAGSRTYSSQLQFNKVYCMTASAAREAHRPEVELAGLRRRFASLLYESLLVLGILAPTFMIPYVLVGMFGHVMPPGWVLWLHLFAVLGIYFVWYWTRHGQTLAMQTWKLSVVDAADGRPLDVRRAGLRFVLCWPSLLCFGLGFLWALLDRDRQFLHDRLADTRIVLLPKDKAN